MNPSGLMIRSGRMRIILGGAFIFLGCLLLFLTHQTFKLQGVERESHTCMQQKDSVVAQLQVCTESKRRLDSALDKERSNIKECLDGQAALKNEHKLEQEKEEDRYKKLMQEFEELKKEKKTIEDELASQQEFLSHSKEEIKRLQAELDSALKEKQQLEEAHESDSLKIKQNKDEAESCQRRLKEIYASLTVSSSSPPNLEESRQPRDEDKKADEEKAKPAPNVDQETPASLDKNGQEKSAPIEAPIPSSNASAVQGVRKEGSLPMGDEAAEVDKESTASVSLWQKEHPEQALGEPGENVNASQPQGSPPSPADALQPASLEVKEGQQEDQETPQQQPGAPDGVPLGLSINLTESAINIEPILNPTQAPGNQGVVGNLAGLDGLDGGADQGYADQEDAQLGEEESPNENLRKKPRMLSQ